MKKIFAFIMSIMLILGVSACTCSRQNQEADVENVEVVVDSTAVDTLVVGVPGEEDIAL